MKTRIPTVFAVIALTVALAACGATPSAPRTGVQSGAITALSLTSLAVNGGSAVTLGATTVNVNGHTANEHALSIGQHVAVTTTDGAADKVDVDLELRGPVTNVNVAAKSLMVAGETVLVIATTRIDLSASEDQKVDTGHTMADLAAYMILYPNDNAEVTGIRNADGAVTATNLELKNTAEEATDGETNQPDHTGGLIASLDTTAHTFILGGLTVNYTGLTLPVGAVNGVEVKVEGSVMGAVLTATSIELASGSDKSGLAGADVSLSDQLRGLDLTAKTFILDGFTVDYSSITVTGTLLAGAEVKVVGKVDATNLHLVHATSVTVHDEH